MMKRSILTVLTLLTLSILEINASRVDTLSVHSDKMKRNIEVVTIIPEQALKGQKCPVLYLLHGYSGNAHTWLGINHNLPHLSDRDGIIVVCPDGENSWYWDSPVNPESQFETFVSKELVDYIDTHYSTIADRKARAITGLSMGGHGGLWLSIRHKDVFGAGGSTSGGVDIRPFPRSWEMSVQLGKRDDNLQRWNDHTVMTQLDKIKNGDLVIIFDCGTSDFFFKVNNQLHNELLKRGIFHDYIVRPGKHNYMYWRNSIEYQWLFFSRYFAGYRTQIEVPKK